MKQSKRRRVDLVHVDDHEVTAGGTVWCVQFTRQFDPEYELDQVGLRVADEAGEFHPIELLDAGLAAGIRQAIADWCEQHPPRPDFDNERDEAYERAASRARGNNFERTGGRDWT